MNPVLDDLNTSVHEAMLKAQFSETPDKYTEVICARVSKEIKETVELICSRNLTTPSMWLRECAIALCRDYGAQPKG